MTAEDVVVQVMFRYEERNSVLRCPALYGSTLSRTMAAAAKSIARVICIPVAFML